jgi:LysR family transcriptional regulator, nitrogen assimilation regulatory protein
MVTKAFQLTIHQIRVFDAVVRNGSLTKAAITLDVPQPSISRMIARLEQDIGTTLVNRSRQGVTLTAAGIRFHLNALESLRFHDLAIEEARALRGLMVGEVRIAAPDSVGGILFAPLVKSFKLEHPGVRLRTFASQSTEIVRMLATDSVDIGIVADTHSLPPGFCEPLFREELYLIGAKSSSFIQKKEIRLAEVAQLPLILNSMPGGFRSVIDHAFSQLGIEPNIEFEIDANNSLLKLLMEGAGFSILPYSLIKTIGCETQLGASRLIEPSLIRTLSAVSTTNGSSKFLVREVTRKIRVAVEKESAIARWLSINSG